MTRYMVLAACLTLAACGTTGPVRVETHDVAVTHVERAVSEADVRAHAPPAPLGARPATVSAALDAALAKLCEYVAWGATIDALAQHAAGMTPERRVNEPVCEGAAP